MHTTTADMLLTQLVALADQHAHVLPWVKQLTEDERAELLADLAQAYVGLRQTGQSQPLSRCSKTGKPPRRWWGTRNSQIVCCLP